jgi:hypothetical protein
MQIPEANEYRHVTSVGELPISKRGMLCPVKVEVVRGGVVVAEGYAEGNLREHVRRSADKAEVVAPALGRVIRPVCGGSLERDRDEDPAKFYQWHVERNWKAQGNRTQWNYPAFSYRLYAARAAAVASAWAANEPI